MLPPPIDINSWLEKNQDKLKPPVNNAVMQLSNDFLVMVVGGPNNRSDYHINQTSEWFYQYKGDMLLKVVINKTSKNHHNFNNNFEQLLFEEITIKEGQMFLLPPLVPHCPVRYKDTVGIVIEKNRAMEDIDKLVWYCEKCRNILYEKEFNCQDIVVKIKQIIEEYRSKVQLRTCKACNFINE